MLDTLIIVLVAIVVFAIVAFGFKWICDRFFPNFPPALWICGIILIVLILFAARAIFSGGGSLHELHF
jgi:hypothetical protein